MARIPTLAAGSLILTLLLVAVPAATAAAQSVQLEEFPAVEVEDLPPEQRRWLERDVYWIITDTEREVFLRLQSDEQRDLFIERFWEVRDPTPGTMTNEYRQLHYERLAYAEKFFGRGTSRPGWRTDRGRIHILLGEPVNRWRYQNPMSTRPAEVWFYSADPRLGVPSFFYVVFYKRNQAGDYRLYSPVSDGPQRLLNPTGQRRVRELQKINAERRGGYLQGFTPTGFGGQDMSAIRRVLMEVDPDLANAAFNLIPSEGGLELISPLQSEMLLGRFWEIPDRIMPDKTWAFNVLTGTTESEVRYETLEMTADASVLFDIDGQPFVHFAVKTEGANLHLGDYEEDYYFTFQVSGSLTDGQTRVLHDFQDTLNGEMSEEQARRLRDSEFVYLDMMPTIPGDLEFELLLENQVSRQFGRTRFEIEVPSDPADGPRLMPTVLGVVGQRLPDFDPFAQRFAFQHGDLAMVPAVGDVPVGQPLLAFQQVLVPESFEGELSFEVRLVDASGEVVRAEIRQPGADQAEEHGVLTFVVELPTEGLEPGSYRLVVEDTAGSAGSVAQPITLEKPASTVVDPFLNAQPAPPAADPAVAAARARQYRARGDFNKAIEWLGKALAKDPDNQEYRTQRVELLEAAGKHRELIDELVPVVTEDPRNAEALRRLAEAHSRLGEHYDAIRYYERLRLATAEETPELLNALAAEYHSEGQLDKAIELLQRSMELDATQPEVGTLLEQLRRAATSAVEETSDGQAP